MSMITNSDAYDTTAMVSSMLSMERGFVFIVHG